MLLRASEVSRNFSCRLHLLQETDQHEKFLAAERGVPRLPQGGGMPARYETSICVKRLQLVASFPSLSSLSRAVLRGPVLGV